MKSLIKKIDPIFRCRMNADHLGGATDGTNSN
jgi:hypothetical protein